MAAGTTEVLQEYLVKLGYTIDTVSQKRLTDGLSATGKRVMDVGKGIAGVVVAVEAATAAFAYSVRSAYFSADLAGTSMKKMEALGYASKQIGISSETAAGSIQAMATALRLNPGLQGFLQGMGIKVTGRDVSDVMNDLVAATKSMAEFQGAQVVGMFGMGADEYHLRRENMEKFNEKQKEALEIQKQMGLDTDKAAKAMEHYTGTLDKLGLQLSTLGKQAMITYAPFFDKIAGVASSVISGLNEKVRETGVMVENVPRMQKGLAEAKKLPDDQAKELYSKLEAKYGLPKGLLWKMEGAESTHGLNMLSPKGAEGWFQFIPKTAEEFNLDNPYDRAQSADAAARKMSGLLKRYKGDVNLGLAAYNWGQGNLDKYGAANAPNEPQDYVHRVTGGDLRLGQSGSGTNTVSQTNHITVNPTSGSDANAVGKAVARETSRQWADVVRNMQ
jgi:Transglycosylase SLT domain